MVPVARALGALFAGQSLLYLAGWLRAMAEQTSFDDSTAVLWLELLMVVVQLMLAWWSVGVIRTLRRPALSKPNGDNAWEDHSRDDTDVDHSGPHGGRVP